MADDVNDCFNKMLLINVFTNCRNGGFKYFSNEKGAYAPSGLRPPEFNFSP